MQLGGQRWDDRGQAECLVPDDQGGRAESRVILAEHEEVKQSMEGRMKMMCSRSQAKGMLVLVIRWPKGPGAGETCRRSGSHDRVHTSTSKRLLKM